MSEIVGQEHVTRTLDSAIKAGKVSHAYLFTGPRGVGKTSIARILAHEVNGLAYTDESAELDIIEIDAASNRRIDEIRDLRDKIHIAPSAAKYKVYIIDEVHMLTKEAFNALLKTLEEPPSHVIFILATTETNKVPETIISRTQRFTFKPISEAEVIKHLQDIAKRENIVIDNDALQLLAQHGGGSFRDSISLLDQISNSSNKQITAEVVESMIGIAPRQLIDNLLQSIFSSSTSDLLSELDNLRISGISAAQVSKQLSARLRQILLEPASQTIKTTPAELTDLLGSLLAVPAAYDPSAKLEYLLLDKQLKMMPPLSSLTQPLADPVSKPIAPTSPHKPITATTPKQSPVMDEPVNKSAAAPDTTIQTIDWWPQFLAEIKTNHNPLYGVLRMCEPRIQESRLVLAFAYPFHQKRIIESANRQKVIAVMQKITGQLIEFDCELDKTVRNNPSGPKTAPLSPHDQLATITEIFGGGEVLET